MQEKSFANGNSPAPPRTQCDDAGVSIRPESHWTLTLGQLPG